MTKIDIDIQLTDEVGDEFRYVASTEMFEKSEDKVWHSIGKFLDSVDYYNDGKPFMFAERVTEEEWAALRQFLKEYRQAAKECTDD